VVIRAGPDDHRLTLEGIIWRFRTGSPWRDLPDHFGACQSVWERHRRWPDDGTYVRMLAAVRATAPQRDKQRLKLLSADSTIVRAHQHAAGAPRIPHTIPEPRDQIAQRKAAPATRVPSGLHSATSMGATRGDDATSRPEEGPTAQIRRSRCATASR
jgi:putative transposase